jgi:uncharacterized protein YjbI with pentapeptide repeats
MVFKPAGHPRAVSCNSCHEITFWFESEYPQTCHLCGETVKLCECLFCSGTNYVCLHNPVEAAYCFDCGYRGDGGDLEGLEADGLDFSYTLFRSATLASIFSRCDFSKSVFTGATMTNEFFKCDFSRADLARVHADGGDLFDLSASFSECDFSHANLSGGNFRGCYFQGSNFFGSNLSNACLDYADLSGVDLRDAILDGATFENAILEDTVFPSNFDLGQASTTFEPLEAESEGTGPVMREDYMRDSLD